MSRGSSWLRVMALARKDAHELVRNPGAVFPAVMMVVGALFPAFLVAVAVPMFAGETLEESGAFADESARAIGLIPELGALSGNALIQAFVFHQFATLLLLVPVVAAMTLATHAVIGEKLARALEPLLATPISTLELLAAKTLTPFLFSLALTWLAVGLYIAGIVLVGEPGVARGVIGVRMAIMFAVLGPLAELAALQVSVIVSSRANDPRSAQQITGLLILPITAIFVAQMAGVVVLGPAAMLMGSLGVAVLNVLLLWVGVQVFQRESILTRWR